MQDTTLTHAFLNPTLGALAALASAFCWAVSAILFRALGHHVRAQAMNLGKGIVAVLCLGALAWPESSSAFPASSVLALIFSGLLGIAVGDTLYFLTLQHLGARLTLLTGSLIPVVTGVVSIVVLGERPAPIAVVGLTTTIAGVTFVLWHRTREAPGTDLSRGIVFGLLFVMAHAAAIILTKIGANDLPTSVATWLRHAASVAGLTFWAMASGALLEWMRPLQAPRLAGQLTLAALVGAVAGSWLSVAALQLTDASVATALNSTSPLFVLPLAAWWLKERVPWQATVGAGVAVGGVAIYFLSLATQPA